jgi:hypothetical protein
MAPCAIGIAAANLLPDLPPGARGDPKLCPSRTAAGTAERHTAQILPKFDTGVSKILASPRGIEPLFPA